VGKSARELHLRKVSICCRADWFYAPKYYDNFRKYKEVPTCMKCGRETKLIKK